MALSLTSRGYKRNMRALRVRIRVKSVSGQQKNLETIMVSRFSGGARYRTRTCDPMHVKHFAKKSL